MKKNKMMLNRLGAFTVFLLCAWLEGSPVVAAPPAGAVSRTQLIADCANFLPDNHTHSITPLALRSCVNELANSVAFLLSNLGDLGSNLTTLTNLGLVGTNGQILVGQTGAVPLFVAMSGDGTLSSSGIVTVSHVNGVAYGVSPSMNTIPVVTGTNAITYEAVPNAALANSAITIAGHAVSLGGSQAIAYSDLSSGAPTATSSVLGLVKPDNTTLSISSGVLSVATNGVANTNLAQTGAGTTKCNPGGSTANVSDCTGSQAESVLNFTQSGSGAVQRPLDAKIKDTILSPEDFGAAGSGANTTGSITATQTILSIASALDFANGQGVRIDYAGAAFSVNQPTSLSVTPTGTTGSTAYAYTIASLDSAGGVGQSIANATTSTGNATLSTTNYNALSWSAPSGTAPAAYAIYGNKSGSLALIGITTATSFKDTGGGALSPRPDYLPAAPQTGASLPDWLVTTITSGGGTSSLTLAGAATHNASSAYVIHDDTAAFNAAIAQAETSESVELVLGCNTSYQISSTLNISAGISIRGCGFTSVGTSFPPSYPSGVSGYTGSTLVAGTPVTALSIATDQPILLRSFGIVYPVRPFDTTIGISASSGGTGSSHLNYGSTIRDVLVWNSATGISESNYFHSVIEDNHVIWANDVGISVNDSNDPTYGEVVIAHNFVQGAIVPTFNAGVRVTDTSAIRVSENLIEFGNSQTDIGIMLIANTGSIEPAFITYNTIEGQEVGIEFVTYSPATDTINTFSVVGNEIYANIYDMYSANGTTQWIAGGTVVGNTMLITGNNASSLTAIYIDNWGGSTFIGNTMSCTVGCSSSTGFNLGSHTTGNNVQANHYYSGFSTQVNDNGTGNNVGIASK